MYNKIMNSIKESYIQLILNHMIGLKEGEKLSINCTDQSLEFAHLLAKRATEISHVPAMIVYIKDGKVESVNQFDPLDNYYTKETGVAMIHLASFNLPRYTGNEELSAPLLQCFSLLSDPIELERRIGVPFSTIYIPNDDWSSFVFGPETDSNELWLLLSDILSLDDEFDSLYNMQHNLLWQRCEKLKKMDIKGLIIENDNTFLNLPLCKTKSISTSAMKINNRTFFPSLPCEDTVILIDKTKAFGKFSTTKPFKLFDTIINNANFTLENGKIVKYDLSDKNPLFERYLNFDESSAFVGQVILCDEMTRINRFDGVFGIPCLDRMRSTHISLGGVDNQDINLSTLEEVENNNINTSFIHLDLPIGNEDTRIYAITEKDEKFLIQEDGIFID